jgi:uncharacterized protein
MRCIALLFIIAAAALAPLRAGEPAPKVSKVLFFTKSSNFEHSVIKTRADGMSFASHVFQRLGPKHAVEFTFSKDGSLFSPEYLAQFDAVVFYTSGDLLSPGNDGNPPMTAEGKQALLEAIRAGKGFVGIHSAADTFHTDETAATNTNQPRTWRYQIRGEKLDPYLKMLGGELIVHGSQQIARFEVIDRKFPGFGGVAQSLDLFGEWYSMTNFSPELHVILLQDTAQMRDPNANGKDWPPSGWDTPYKRPPYPSTWAHAYGRGRVFYTSMGHREEEWLSPLFESVVFGGLDWALGRVTADVKPNITKVAPRANELPPVSGPVGGLPKAVKAAEEAKYYPR